MTSTKKSNVRQSQSKKPTFTSLSENFHRYFCLRIVEPFLDMPARLDITSIAMS